jgi:hypothetical protein
LTLTSAHRTAPEPGQIDQIDLDGALHDLEGAIDVRLPGGWWLRHFVQATGQRVIEIHDTSRDLVALVASATWPHVSIDAAWRGFSAMATGERRWWALAVGHARRGTDPTVTFASRLPRGQVRRLTVTPNVIDGLWVAMAFGPQGTVSLRQGPHQRVHRISPTFRARS